MVGRQEVCKGAESQGVKHVMHTFEHELQTLLITP